jgi:hypothetical protein
MPPDDSTDVSVEAETVEEALHAALARVDKLEEAVRAARPVIASVAMRGSNGLRSQATWALALIDALKL